MAEESGSDNVEITQEQQGQEQQEQSQENQSQEQSEHVSALGALGGWVSDKNAEKLSNLAKNAKPEVTTVESEIKKSETTKTEVNKTTSSKPDAEDDDAEPSVLGIKNPNKKTGDNVVVIEKPEDILGIIKKDFGQDYKDIKEVSKFFESTQKWRKDSQDLVKIKSEHDNIIAVLDATPVDIIEAIKLHHNGQDYMAAFKNRPAFNFDIPVEKQNIEELVNHYFPGKFTPEDFSEEIPPSALEIAISASKDKYNYTKATRDNESAMREQNAKARLQSIDASVQGSLNYLTQSFPNADQEVTKTISSTLEGGIQKVAEMFYNSDGTVKQDAAERLMLALHGKSEISRMMKIAERQAESKTNEDLVTRSSDSAKPSKNGQIPDKISEDVMAQIKALKNIKGTSERTFK